MVLSFIIYCLELEQSLLNTPRSVEQRLTSPPTQYRLYGQRFYRSKDPTNSIKVLKKHKEYTNKRKIQQIS